MTGKSRGPSFKRRMIRLAECPVCHGKAVVQGVFYELIVTLATRLGGSMGGPARLCLCQSWRHSWE